MTTLCSLCVRPRPNCTLSTCGKCSVCRRCGEHPAYIRALAAFEASPRSGHRGATSRCFRALLCSICIDIASVVQTVFQCPSTARWHSFGSLLRHAGLLVSLVPRILRRIVMVCTVFMCWRARFVYGFRLRSTGQSLQLCHFRFR